jgi:hypothetical protein
MFLSLEEFSHEPGSMPPTLTHEAHLPSAPAVRRVRLAAQSYGL